MRRGKGTQELKPGVIFWCAVAARLKPALVTKPKRKPDGDSFRYWLDLARGRPQFCPDVEAR